MATRASSAITPSCVGQQRIDIEFADFWVARDQIAEPDQGIGNGVDIGRRPIAVALQQAPDPGLAHHVARQIVIEGRQGMGGVAQNFNGGAAGTEHHQRTERLDQPTCQE